jgi:predicted DsbA family dithiol-disulfide isomerase
MRKLRVDVFADLACPWCFVGKRRLDAALARMPEGAAVEVVWRSFELDPKAPRVRRARATYAERLAKKYRAPIAQANAVVERLLRIGAGEGIAFQLDRVRPGNSFDAHRVLHLARERGVQGAAADRLFRAYFTEGVPLGDRKELARVGAEAGLDPGEVARVLAGDAHGDAVRADEEEAARLGIHAVPFFGLGAYAVSGAQSADVLHGALVQAWDEVSPEAAPG